MGSCYSAEEDMREETKWKNKAAERGGGVPVCVWGGGGWLGSRREEIYNGKRQEREG